MAASFSPEDPDATLGCLSAKARPIVDCVEATSLETLTADERRQRARLFGKLIR